MELKKKTRRESERSSKATQWLGASQQVMMQPCCSFYPTKALKKKITMVGWHTWGPSPSHPPGLPFTVLSKDYPFEKSIKTSNEPLESIRLWDSFSHYAGRKTKMKKIYFSLAFFKAFTTLALVAVASAAPQAIIEKFPLPCWISFNLSSSIALEITLLWSI